MIKLIKEWVGPLALLLLKGIRVQHHRLSLSKTIFFNFKSLPLRQACKLPVFIYHNTSLYRIGKIEIKSKRFPRDDPMGETWLQKPRQWQDLQLWKN